MTDHLVQQILDCEREIRADADGFVFVTVARDTGVVYGATGPFDEPEQALTAAGEADATWKREAAGEGDFDYLVVPLWGPTA
jgi:hypothetical protein